MLFSTRVYDAVISHVKTKIKAAEEKYQLALKEAKTEYRKDIKSAKQKHKQKQTVALEQAVQSVLKGM